MKPSILISPGDYFPLKMLWSVDIIDWIDGNWETLGAFFLISASVCIINDETLLFL